MKFTFRLRTGALLVSSVAILSAACGEQSASAQASSSGPSNPDQVVAEVGGKAITLKDVDAKWEEFDAAERARIVQAMYQNRRNMLDLICARTNLDRYQAHTLCSLAADLRVTQVVNGNKGIHVMLEKKYLSKK